jgi:signal transduction histidine kinase
LRNLLAATDLAALFLDRNLRISWFTPKANELFSIGMTDRGRPILDLTHRLGDTSLEEDASRVFERLIPIEREVEDQAGHWYVTRIMPYRSSEDCIEGVVITFLDITAQRRAEDEARTAKEYAEQLEQRVEIRTEELQRQNQRLRSLATQLTQTEQRERERLARILHDGLQQILVGAKLQLPPNPPEALKRSISKISAMLDEAIEITRTLTYELTPPMLRKGDLTESLRWLAHWLETNYDFEIVLEVQCEFPQLPEDLRIFLFSVARELLLNAVKHSGVNQARVAVQRDRNQIRLTVVDQGRGMLVSDLQNVQDVQAGYGLFSIRERLLALGGSLDIASQPGDGAKFTITLPFSEGECER